MAQDERLKALTDAGVAVWLDQIHREMIEGGDLKALVDEKSLRGETSNPAIFEKAIMGGDAYDDKIEKFAGEGLDARETYLRLADRGRADGVDVMRPVRRRLTATTATCRWRSQPPGPRRRRNGRAGPRAVDGGRGPANVMIKIPGTTEGGLPRATPPRRINV